jgi:hypothetical protein
MACHGDGLTAMSGLGFAPWQAAVLGGSGSSPSEPVPDLPATGLISEWRFAEGSGDSVNDEVGANDINLTTPTNPNATWTAYGLATALGLIQTPSVAGVRTVAVLARIGRGETAGFLLSGGNAGSGSGIQGDSVTTTYAINIGGGQGIAPLKSTAAGLSAVRVNRGGFQLFFCEFASAGASVLGFGGRHSTTTSRCTDFEIMWAAAWSGQLTSQNRLDAYGYARNLAKLRSKPIDYRDCSTKYDCILLLGQSNADGRAPIASLSAPDQARTTPNSVIMPANAVGTAAATYPPAGLVLGTNQQKTAPATNFGPEMGAAWSHEDGLHPRKLAFSKTAVGSTWLVASASGLSSAATTWNTAELANGGLFWGAMRNWWDIEQHSLINGIGPRLRAIWWMQGEQDATDATLVASGAYQANLQSLYDTIVQYTAAAALPIVVGRIRDQDPTMNATAAADVRTAQAAFVTANSGVATLIDTDSFALLVDAVHYNAVGMKSLGQAFYAATSLAD